VGKGSEVLGLAKDGSISKTREEFLKLLYAGSNVIGMMLPSDNHSTDEFRREAEIAVQCSTEAKLKVEHDSIVGKLSKDFRSGQCLAAMDALVRSIQ
jgi:hypothetical protein